LNRLTRRTIIGAAAAAIAAAAAGVWRRLSETALDRAAPGPVSPATLNTVVAAAAAIIAKPIERSHYAEYFRWRAEHLPRYRAVYEGLAADVDRAARRAVGCAFAACGDGVRARLLAPAERARSGRTPLDLSWRRSAGRRWVTYNTMVFDEALALFAGTDAWTLIGYEGWPGTPRGLDHYRHAPR
jgi:hypothetical protein